MRDKAKPRLSLGAAGESEVGQEKSLLGLRPSCLSGSRSPRSLAKPQSRPRINKRRPVPN